MSGVVALSLWAVPVAGQDAAQIEKGKAVYDVQKCALCHSIAGRGNTKGPLDNVGSRLNTEDLRKWIVSPKEMKAPANRKPDMRAYPSLPAADLDALVAFMGSLKGA